MCFVSMMPAREVVEVLGDREVIDSIVRVGRARRLADQLMTQSIRNTRRSGTPATIWFFVRLEMKQADRDEAAAHQQQPEIARDDRPPLRIAEHEQDRDVEHRHQRASRRRAPSAPMNLPRMISRSVTGDVSSSSIVPDRFSSE